MVEAMPDQTVSLNVIEALMTELSGVVSSMEALPDYLDGLVHAVRAAVDGCDAVGVTVVVDDRPRTAAYTTAGTLEIDAVQYAVGDGPCLDAFRNRRENLVDLETAGERWPMFIQSAPRSEVQTLLALPLVAADQAFGALNLYGYARQAFDVVDRNLVRMAASRAADAIAAAVEISSARTLAGHLELAMASRAVIEQAKGIVMGRHGVDEEHAFDLLRRQSQNENVKLRDLAASLVGATTGTGPVAGSPSVG